MSDIKLIIKISEEDYEIMKHNISVNNQLCPLRQEEMVAIVANGTPLDEVFNKMRAGIEQIEINGHIRDFECFSAGINTALNIIDNYWENKDV